MIDKYFELRSINQNTYNNYNIPMYLKSVLTNKEARILDYGCGFGQLIVALRKAGFSNVEGADINPIAIKSLHEQQVIAHNLLMDKDFHNKNSEKFDIIIMSHVLEHIPKYEIVGILNSVRSLLTNEGSLIVMVPNAQSNTGCYWAYEDFTHHLLFTAGSLHYVLKSANFSEVSFLDVDGLAESSGLKKIFKKFLLSLYILNHNFWNKVTSSYLHKPSPKIFSYEIKAIAKK